MGDSVTVKDQDGKIILEKSSLSLNSEGCVKSATHLVDFYQDNVSKLQCYIIFP